MSHQRFHKGYTINFGNEGGSRWWWAVSDPRGVAVGGAGQAKTKEEALSEARRAIRGDMKKKRAA